VLRKGTLSHRTTAETYMQPSTVNAQPSDSQRLIGLDILRAVAVILVLWRHLPPLEGQPQWLLGITDTLQRGGWVGVDVFFVLSGFLVSGLLFREYIKNDSVSVGRFLFRRAFKIYPAFYLMIAAFLTDRWIMGLEIPIEAVIREVFFIQNYKNGLVIHTWSLAVEEHFYLLLAGMVWLLVRYNSRNAFARLPQLFCVILLATLFLRLQMCLSNTSFRYYTFFFPTHLRIDALMFGVLLSYWWHFKATPDQKTSMHRWRGALIAAGTLGLMPAFIWQLERTWWMPVFGVMLFYVAGGCLVLGMLGLRSERQNGVVRILARTGTASYSIYVWHILAANWMYRSLKGMALEQHWALLLVCYFTVTWLFGMLMARLVEFPALKLRDKVCEKAGQFGWRRKFVAPLTVNT
jgi:peptidoglycan/LPS O-acetylase OafA/YrhL